MVNKKGVRRNQKCFCSKVNWWPRMLEVIETNLFRHGCCGMVLLHSFEFRLKHRQPCIIIQDRWASNPFSRLPTTLPGTFQSLPSPQSLAVPRMPSYSDFHALESHIKCVCSLVSLLAAKTDYHLHFLIFHTTVYDLLISL